MSAHGLEGGLQERAAAAPLICLLVLDTQEASRVLAFHLFTDRFLFSFLGIGNGREEERRGLLVYFTVSAVLCLFCCFAVTLLLVEMEEKKSSFVDEFFPEKEAALPSKSDILSSIFPPRSPVARKDSFRGDLGEVRARRQGNEGLSLTEQMGASSGSFQSSPRKNQEGLKTNNEPNVPRDIAEPFPMSSSVFYGGRDNLIPESASSYKSGSTYNYKNDSEDGSNSDAANRGEWWQGSFYY
ncbi:uncharacterized protein LOC110031357 [Phalaenopsis equestris]|uniref:uncharacterized protein LOC110031357 n=1 Tax=Phalaenopsis equestris TaxID=78828 RepID=UPI0009E34DDC|nr:uncharacterized protein LOC110031357 [Phalaenopsis equestris]XP_020590178.1 uncharacterized protein LOC110031357 [Phalaenopsis equestris]XP_020590180.1 uncharacterized protein LOC110031357 [Phalaenopsis equestris]